MSVSRHHAEWLSLVETSGPFLSLPVLMRVFPQGLDPRDPEQAKQLRLAHEEWQANPKLAGKQRSWIMFVLEHGLGYPQELIAEGQTLPPGLSATMAEYAETLRPGLVLVGPAGSQLAGKPQLLINIYPAEQSLDTPVAGKHWKANPGTRMMELLHASGLPLGLITNGEQWMLVFAPRGETTGFTSWYASLWIDEPITLRAFLSLLSARRFFGVAPSDTLLELLKESAQDQQEVTNQLGDQVRDAVEVLIQAFDRLDQDSGRMLLKGSDEGNLYDAALTVMMRLVFLFSAEERCLLHLGKPIYDENYAVSTLRDQLQEVADQYGEEVLERRHDAWARLLATFRAVHAGVSHQDLMLPAYGGSLFDPDRYPFLEGRPHGSCWQSKPAEPLEINNRVVLHLLKSLQMLQVKVPGGGSAEARRISFRALDIEQIGHIYEGLLDHTAMRTKEVVLGLAASRKKPVASMDLSELEKLRQQDPAKLIEALEEETGRSVKALENALKNGGPLEEFHKILVACGQDQKLADRVVEFGGLLRQDSFERPVIVLPGGIYVGQGSARRSTGTHYTPRSLTEPIVQHTLEPLVYKGPAEGLAKEQWQLKSPAEILDLKVCDMAMGSGAFLVQACRYLSERLVEAWEDLEKAHPGEVLITPEGQFSQGEPSERLIPKEAVERLAIARRLVADRCLYGVDINPMAVEMAKLSIWLITVDKSRPFNFLNHALKSGDSLLGISRFKQLETFSLDDENAKQVIILSNYDELIKAAIAKRRELEMRPSNDSAQIATKQALLDEAEERMERLKLAADLLIAAELKEGKEQKKEMARVAAHLKVAEFVQKPVTEFKQFAREQLNGRRTLHWPLEFPEIIIRGGFDGFIGNPPFLGGQRISFRLDSEILAYLKTWLHGSAGTTDLCVYFLLRACCLARLTGCVGLVLSDIISQGDSRISGLDRLLTEGVSIYDCMSSMDWPGYAGVKVCQLHVTRQPWNGVKVLDGVDVSTISSHLRPQEIQHAPKILKQNQGLCFTGHYLMGQGFVLTSGEAAKLIQLRSANQNVIFSYVRGDDINNHPLQNSGELAINFSMRELDDCERNYPECTDRIRRLVKPERDLVKRKAYRERWWRYAEARPGLEEAIRMLEKVIVQPFTAKYMLPTFVDAKSVFAHPIVVIVKPDFGIYACLQSTIHEKWLWEYCSTSLDLFRYTASTVLETFPFLESNAILRDFGKRYYEYRQALLASRREQLTSIYNRFHKPSENSEDIIQLRRLHRELDLTIAAGYGWSDVDLSHGFHETRQGIRFTVSESARKIVLDRLLALNHKRHEEETGSNLVEKKPGTTNRAPAKNRVKRTATAQGELL
jgi:hypothetical protein